MRAAKKGDSAARVRCRILPSLATKSDAGIAAFPLALHDAQSVIAREHGFDSWTALCEQVEELTLSFNKSVGEFLRCATAHNRDRAERLLAIHPGIAAANFHTALVLGDIGRAESRLAKNPVLATARGGPRDWEPLLYVCQTCLHRCSPERTAGLVAIARRLLELGANPNASSPWRGDPAAPLSALWGAACEARIPALVGLLLDAGASVNDGESIYHAAENGDVAMLDLLLAHGVHVDGGENNRWGNTPLYLILGHSPGSAQADTVRAGAQWLVAHGADPNRICYPDGCAETPLHAAARGWDPPMLELLVRHGAQIGARRADGRTPFALAALLGNRAAAAWLKSRGAADELGPAERFVAACTSGDRDAAAAMLRVDQGLRDTVARDANARRLLHKVAARGDAAALETMLVCGFDIDARDEGGATALHWAAWHGWLEATRLLLSRGARVDVNDKEFDAPPLGWADHGSVNCRQPRGDYAGVALALLRAGSPVDRDASSCAPAVQEALVEFRRENTPGS
ncbi:MAG: ankyrin repeat domain-containing protein [Opitutae bacterium]|nr:ankyrin repeat domain-containing protein [Opitutae bacterium]